MPLLTLADAKTELKIESTNYDDQLQEYIDAAIDAVQFICGLAETASVTETVNVSTNQIALRRTPVVSVQSINGEYAGAQTTGNFYLNTEAGVLTIKAVHAPLLNDFYTVTYTTGRAAAPSAMRQAAIVILKYQWNNVRVTNARKTTDDTSVVPGLGFAIPNAALQMLIPYDQGPAVG